MALDSMFPTDQDAPTSALTAPVPLSTQPALSSLPEAQAGSYTDEPRSAPHTPQRALYLRWRPGRFADVLGQDHVTRTLRNAVAAGQVAHAYLFCGPRGTGKTSIARILYKAIACERPQDGDACDACDACRDVGTGRALDLVEIDAASNRGIDHIRDLREKVWIAPSQAPRKMYILDEAHQLSGPAWDAFLKTLEEPPPHVVFVLATTEVHKVPATILSRCQRFDLGRIALNDLVAHLSHVVQAEGLRAEPAVLQRVARLSRGGVRDALSTLDQLVAYSGEAITLAAAREVLGLTAEESLRATAEALAHHDARAALEIVSALAQEGADLRQFLDDLIAYLRALLLARLGASDVLVFEFGADEQAWLEAQAGAWQPAQLVDLVRRLSAVDPRGRDPGQLQVHLELAILDAALAGPLAPVSAPAPITHRPPAPTTGPAAPAMSSQNSAVAAPTAPIPAAPGILSQNATVAAPTVPSSPPPLAGDATRDTTSVAAGGRGPAPSTHVREPVTPLATAPAQTVSVQPHRIGERPDAGDYTTATPAASDNGAHAAAPPESSAPPTPDLAVVRHRWAQFVEAVFVQVPKAGIALEAATPVGLRNGELRLAFTSEFHQSTIEGDVDCRRAVEQVLADELGLVCRLRCGPAEARQPALLEDSFLQQAVELFGATGVERLDDEPAAEEEQP